MYMIHSQSQAAGTSSSISATPQRSSAASMIPSVIVETVEQMEVPSSLLSPIEKVYTCTFKFCIHFHPSGIRICGYGAVVGLCGQCGRQSDALGYVVVWPSV